MAVTRQYFEVFRFLVMQSTFCFPNIAIITIPAASLINYFRPKRAVEFLNESFYNMRCVVMFITAVCLIFEQYKLRDSKLRLSLRDFGP